MKATQSDSEESISEEDEKVEEMANLCLMAREDESLSDSENEVIKNFMNYMMHLMTCIMNFKNLVLNMLH